MSESKRSPIATQAGYDLWSPHYDAFDNPLIAMATIAMRGWLGEVRERHVLELGCGTGRNAPAIVAAGARSYVGVDASTGMLAVARARAVPGVATFVQAELGAPLPVEPADEVLFCLVLEHFADVGPVLAHAAARIAPGGRLRLFELHADLRRAGTGAHFAIDGVEHALPSYAHDATELTSVLRGVGCVIETSRDWIATPDAVAASQKLQRHLGRAVLLEIGARRAS